MDQHRLRQFTRVAVVVGIVWLAVCANTLAGATSSTGAFEQPGVDPDDVLLEIEIDRDGSATWHIEYRTRLDDENTTQAFQSLEDDIETDSGPYRTRFASRIDDMVAGAERQTGREMSADGFTVETSTTQIPQEYGVLTYTFEWHGFAAVNNEQIVAGDALTGLFLDARTTLLVSWPTDFETVEVAPAPDDQRTDAVVWTGPTDFAANEPRIVVAPAAASEGSDGTASGMRDTSVSAVAGVLVLVVVAGLGWVRADTVSAGRLLDWGSNGDANDGPDELLSNEERVLQLLDERERVKQKAVAEEFDWTAAKTSQVVSELREADEIDVFRLGRENVISLPDE